MVSVLQGYIAGGKERRAESAAKTTETFKGLQMEQIRSAMRGRKAESVRAAELDKGYGLLSAGQLGRAGEVFQGLGKVGREGSLAVREQQEFNEEEALDQAKRANDIYKGLPEDQKAQFQQSMIADFAGRGALSDEQADQLSFMDPVSFGQTLDRITGAEAKLPTGDFVVYEKPDGTTVNVNEASAKGQKLLAENPDWIKAPERVLTGELPKTEETQLRDYESVTDAFLTRGQSILDLLEANPEANTVVSVLEKTAMNLMTEARQLASDAGFDSLEDEIRGYDAAGTSSFLEKQGITSARMKGQIVALAYMQAKIFDKGGRVTDKDFKFALKALGANNSNPKAFAATLKDQMRLAESGFRSDYRRRKKKAYEGSFGAEQETVAPHGERVVQNGVTFVWDGNKYVAEQ